MFYPATAMDPRVDSRGYKRKRHHGETFGRCDTDCFPTHPAAMGAGRTVGASGSSQGDPSFGTGYNSEVANVSRTTVISYRSYCHAHELTATDQIKAIYEELLARLPSLLYRQYNITEHNPHQDEPSETRRFGARRVLDPVILQDLSELAFQGVNSVTRSHETPAGSRDRYSLDTPPISTENGLHARTGTHLSIAGSTDSYGYLPEYDHYQPTAPSYHESGRSQEQSSYDFHSAIASTRPDSTPASHGDYPAQYKAYSDGNYKVHVVPQSTSTPKDLPTSHQSGTVPSAHKFGPYPQSESMQSSTGSSSGSSVRCLNCDKRETPEWRKGPYGPRTLCNACVSGHHCHASYLAVLISVDSLSRVWCGQKSRKSESKRLPPMPKQWQQRW